jgi:transcriptional regulator with XRE-family HTH domain
MNDFTWMEVGQRLRDWRIAAQLTQRALGERVGLSQPAIQAIEVGTCNPQLNSLQLLASALGRTTRELVCGQLLVHDPRAQRLERVLSSGHPLAITAAEQGLSCAEALLQLPATLPKRFGKARSGFSRTLSTEDTVALGGLMLRPPEGSTQATTRSESLKGATEMRPTSIRGKSVGFNVRQDPTAVPAIFSDNLTDLTEPAQRRARKRRSEEHLE